MTPVLGIRITALAICMDPFLPVIQRITNVADTIFQEAVIQPMTTVLDTSFRTVPAVIREQRVTANRLR